MVSKSVAILARTNHNFKDMRGLVFDQLTVLRRIENNSSGKAMWLCLCSCGKSKEISGDQLRGKQKTFNCGCAKRKPKMKVPMAGLKFGRLLVLRRGPDAIFKNQIKVRWFCLCDCGKECLVAGNNMRMGSSTSCGCYKNETVSNRSLTHGLSGTKEEIMHRCAKGRAKRGGFDFDIQIEDVFVPEFCPLLGIKIEQNLGKRGPTPNSPSLDRIESSKGYVKGNVWVISHKANTIKSDATPLELRTIADRLERKINEVHSNTSKNEHGS